ncbi:MAG: D-2-hydroxyacid dehydrogenase [Burkholderiaceae bacterium]
MKILYWARLGMARAPITERLGQWPEVTLVVTETLEDTLRELPAADALVAYDAPVALARQVSEVLAAPGCRVRWIHFLSAGREGFEAAGLPGRVTVSQTAGATAPTVAEHAMALLLALARRVPEMVELTRDARWDRALATNARSLEGGVLAILGPGQIGREIARRAKAFGMTTIGLSRSAAPHPTLDETLGLDQLHATLARADAIAVAIALAPETRHILDARAFAVCTRKPLLVNIARGAVIDQAALVAALHAGQIGGAGLDVTDPEPLPASDPLWRCPNLLISPHFAAGGSARSVARVTEGLLENLRRFSAGETAGLR